METYRIQVDETTIKQFKAASQEEADKILLKTAAGLNGLLRLQRQDSPDYWTTAREFSTETKGLSSE